MPSSISSSNFEPPGKPWALVLLLACLLTAGIAASVEATWRSQGYQPGVVDSPSYWALVRAELEGAGTKQVAIVGSSRFQLGLNPEVLEKTAPDFEFHQLSINGGNPLPILEDLAADESFGGIVLFEFTANRIAFPDNAAMARSRVMLAAYHDGQLVDWPERMLRTLLQSRLVLLHEGLNVKQIIRGLLLERALPRPERTMLPNRFIDTGAIGGAALERAEDAALAGIGGREKLNDDEVAERYRAIAAAAETIRARGGDVLFFRPNSSSEALTIEQNLFPREQYYEQARQMIGGTWLHYEDDPVLRNDVDVPDGVHAMGDGATIMSRRVAELLFAD